MKVIAGLGNPGTKYSQTKHNVGFMFLDALSEHLGIKETQWHDKFEAQIAETRLGVEKIMLVKPQTYMNESGRSIGALISYFKVPLEDFIVIYDDLDQNVGLARLRKQGASGGHNGINSIISHLGDNHFARLRIGIGRPLNKEGVIDYVLSSFSAEDKLVIMKIIREYLPSIEVFIKEGIDMAMNRFNKKKR